jgi:hypothetical protein
MLSLAFLLLVVAGIVAICIPAIRARAVLTVQRQLGRLRHRLGFSTLKSIQRQAIRSAIAQRHVLWTGERMPDEVTVELHPLDYKAHQPVLPAAEKEISTEIAAYADLRSADGVESRGGPPEVRFRSSRNVLPGTVRTKVRFVNRTVAGNETVVRSGGGGGLLVIEAEGRRYPLTGTQKLGRDPKCEIVVRDPGVSRVHGMIEVADGRILVSDLGSSNGTFVNERRVVGRVAVTTKDELRFGTDLVVALQDERATQPLIATDS